MKLKVDEMLHLHLAVEEALLLRSRSFELGLAVLAAAFEAPIT